MNGIASESFQQLAFAAQERRDHLRAVDLFLRAIEADPRNWIAHTCLGNTLKAMRRFDDAVEVQRRAVELSGDRRALSNLALTYREMGRLDDAAAALREAIALAPGDAELHGNLAGVLLECDRAAEAEAVAQRALEIDPAQARAESHLGHARKEQGDLGGAAGHLRRAIALNPDDADAHWNLGLALLAAAGGGADGAAEDPAAEARRREGWRELEWRRRIPSLRVPAPEELDRVPAWEGEPLGGRTLLLQAEQGLGDTLQLARYAAAAKRVAGAGRVVLECQPPIEALLRRCAGVDAVVARGRALPEADARALLFSMPLLMAHAGEGAVVAPAGAYLAADPDRVERWRAVLSSRAGRAFRIGIAWQGNRRYRADGRRSIPVTRFVPVLRAAAAAGARVFSLQKGEGREQLAALPPDTLVDDLATDLDTYGVSGGAFLDSAAVMAGLDLVITSDTAMAHLAGALGVPVWVPLAHRPDWRWGQTGERTAWYATMRLFRQAAPGDWGGVFERVAAELASAAAHRAPRGVAA
jgi:tetratricopeptide (TPR) repeat protein